MKKLTLSILILLLFIAGQQTLLKANEPDSAYIFAYATDKNNNHNGLHFAWSQDKRIWHPIGPEHSFVKSDYGRWGSQKKMFDPFLFQAPDGMWHCVWSLNNSDGAFAHASSSDLIYWGRQSYPLVQANGNCLDPEIFYENGLYHIIWKNDKSSDNGFFSVKTKKFKQFSEVEKLSTTLSRKNSVLVLDRTETGTIHKVSWKTIAELIKTQQLAGYKNTLYAERAKDDTERFASLTALDASIKIQANESRKISDLLLGVFYEDINYAADGGLYAELIQNRSFEYTSKDRNDWNNRTAWMVEGDNVEFKIDTIAPIHPNNKHYASLNIKNGATLINEGSGGIAVKKGDTYYFSAFARTSEAKKGKLTIRLTDKNGKIIAEANTKKISDQWKKHEIALVAKATVYDAKLEVQPEQNGRVDLDMISLFPQKTFKGRRNGLREDLAQVLADMNPRFVRFPGGCVAHGDGLDNIYHWKNTIGPLESRKGQRNLWGYYQSFGLGYFEFFQFCKDIGAEPLPVVAAGIPCQNSGHHGHALGGQQGGIPMCEMDSYVQDVLDLIEWANGGVNTVWGKKRAEAGHPEPFNLKYIGVGNEDLITDIFEERFKIIFDAVKQKYPEIMVVGTSGPFYEGTDYVEGWDLATRLGVPIIDEHYYNPPGWYIHNQDFYDKYDRSKSKVYLGEYAAHLPGRPNNIETALVEALHLCNVERNGDVVIMTSYAPLLGKEGYTQWNPNLIYFNNTEVKPTVGYHIQKLFGQNSGNEYLFSKLSLSNNQDAVGKRVVASVVRDSKTGDVIIKLVNLLPVSVNMSLDLSEIAISNTIASVTVLTGAPDDKQAKPQSDFIDVNNNYMLQPYTFSVIRLKTK